MQTTCLMPVRKQAIHTLNTLDACDYRLKLVTATIDELAGRADSRKEELDRMARMGKTYQLDAIQAAARQRLNSLLHPHAPASSSSHTAGAAALAAAAAAAGGPAAAGSGSLAAHTYSSGNSSAGGGGCVVAGNVWGACDVCREEVPDMRCSSCRRWLHALCCSPAALTPAEYPHDMQQWTCPACSATNTVSHCCCRICCAQQQQQQQSMSARKQTARQRPGFLAAVR
jgi:hypothetical protein